MQFKDINYIDKQQKTAERKSLKENGICITANFYEAVIEIYNNNTLIIDENILKKIKKEYFENMQKISKRGK